MPSLRERLGRKRNKTPKKAKSTGDLENVGSESDFKMSKDYSSQMSGIGGNEFTEGHSEETTSVVSSSTTDTSHGGKKKRFSFKKLRKSLTKKKTTSSSHGEKRVSLVEGSNGSVVLVQEVVSHDDFSAEGKQSESGVGVRRTQSCHVHSTIADKTDSDSSKEQDRHGQAENPDNVDDWRMSGLLDTVERSNSVHSASSKTNLSQPSSARTDKNATKVGEDNISTPVNTSTPKADRTDVPTISFDLVADTPDAGEDCLPAQPISNPDLGSATESTDELTDVSAESNGVQDNDGKNRDESRTAQTDEEKFVETHNLDYEYSSQDTQLDGKDESHTAKNESSHTEGVKPGGNTIEVQLNVKFQNGPTAKVNGKGDVDADKAIICALEEAIKSGEMKINQDILANELLVLNLAKDDWVIVDYNQTNGEIIEIFDRSLEVK